MSDSVYEWLDKSRATMAAMERDLQHHQTAMEAAMASYRSHGEKSDALEQQLEIIGNALAAAEAAAARSDAAQTQTPAVKPTAAPAEPLAEVDPSPTVHRIEPASVPHSATSRGSGHLAARPQAPPLRAVDFS